MDPCRRAWIAVGVALLAGCGAAPEQPGREVTAAILPADAAGWSAAGEAETWDTETIYAYIDGHAEVYLAYGMKRCVSRRYAAPAGDDEIVVDLFEMASPEDAFGVFSHDRAGEPVAVGNDGVLRHGWLSFWQGSWYGSVYATGAGEASADAVLAVGEAVAASLPEGGEVPALVHRLPAEGLEAQSATFLRSPHILNAHVWIGSDNLFELGPEAEAVVGKYELGEAAAHLLLVRYPDETAAARVEARARTDASASDRPEMIVGRAGGLVAAVIGPDTGEAGLSLLERALGGDS
ncbi:MAG TPA: DUF6599 family protein [Candidatus Sulfomarinibacteraceae bacterium]|nr:DUF6599 family protein [Candidatus Sulfomarinibacteraceae bacterium]